MKYIAIQKGIYSVVKINGTQNLLVKGIRFAENKNKKD